MNLKQKLAQAKEAYGKTGEDKEIEIEDSKFPLQAEPAVVHPINHSSIKIKDNGMIDIFVETDIGIRIDAMSKTINLIGNTIQETASERHSVVKGSSVHEIEGPVWSINVVGDAKIETGANALIKTAGNAAIESEGAIQMKAKGSISIVSEDGDVNIASNKSDEGNVNISAENHVSIKQGHKAPGDHSHSSFVQET